MHDRSGDTLRRLAENGSLKTAQKIGRNWVVDSDEEYPIRKRTRKKVAPITVASLFSGCGGMDLGLIGGFDFLGTHYGKTGFEIIWANEINPAACKTYRENFGDYIIEGDISEYIDDLPSSVDIVVGGFPCQDISINGKMLGVNGKRSSLYTYIVAAVRKTNPMVFIAENVGGLLLKQNEYSLNKILSDFSSLGYNLHYQLYHAEEYGVPQTRERVIFVGTKKGLPEFIPPQRLNSDPITAYDALHDLEDHPVDKHFAHIWSNAKASGEQGNRKLIADRPGYTMRAECHGNIQFHYSLPRRISMREAARIQSFPDTFSFPCGLRETERQIGNAVPPVFAWHIANAVKEVMKGRKYKYDNR
ncbi:MAG: DNA cytosine methyltransferase [Christensenellaceae bacterium]|nr:DNA cytosine methyltransferase [Christensenellaceae bacterium]